MKKYMRILSAIFVLIIVIQIGAFSAFAEEPKAGFQIDAKSGILMEASTGKVLFEQNPDEALPPASVTKVMTLLLVMEAIDNGVISLTDNVSISAHASSMGGSQVYLKEGEEMTVEDLLKSVVISSANDAAVALAEYVAGSEESFVSKMNEKAAELGMVNTKFENTNGLDDTVTSHLTSARDIALMSRELISHEKILEYSSIWMDTIRNGAFGLTNTNRLIRFYKGANGLKTGSTSKAKFCITATAERDGMTLISVVMGAPTRDIRNAETAKMLDWGFANYAIYKLPEEEVGEVRVLGGVSDSCKAVHKELSCVVSSSEKNRIEKKIELSEKIAAPVHAGDIIGMVRLFSGENEIGSVPVTAAEDIAKISFFGVFKQIMKYFCMTR